MSRSLARRALSALSSVAGATLLAATLAGTAQAHKIRVSPSSGGVVTVTPSTPITRGSGYLALGDSISFGYMEPTVVPTPDYADAASFVGFPEILASELHLKLANAACPGETSSSLINDTAPSEGCDTPGPGGGIVYRKLFPLHVKYSGSQLAYGVSYLKSHPGVRLVTLMIGANDYFRCVETTADGCTSLAEEASLALTLKRNVHTIVAALRDKAHYNGQIVVLDTYTTEASQDPLAQEFNGFINEGAAGLHVRIDNALSAFTLAAAHSGGNVCTAGLLTQLSTGGCGDHPSYAGQTLLAATVERLITLP